MGVRWIRSALTGAVLCSILFFAYLLVVQWRALQSSPATVSHSVLESADAGIQGFTYRQTQSGAIQWEVEARLARVFESEHQTFLEDVQIHWYRPSGWGMTIDAENGTIDTETNDLQLENQHDPIVVSLANGYTIFTQHLGWKNANQEFHTDDPVHITGNGLTLTGTGLVGNPESGEFTILKDVQLELTS